jgi:hypothetical protein
MAQRPQLSLRWRDAPDRPLRGQIQKLGFFASENRLGRLFQHENDTPDRNC